MIIDEPKDITLNISEKTRKHLEMFFGKTIPDNKLAALVGAIDGSVIEISPRGNGFVSDAKHEYLVEQTRIGGKDEDLGLFIINEYFMLTGDAPEGIGRTSFIRQVITARELGFRFIRTYAAGSIDDPDGFIGYSVWAKFGFNAALKPNEIESLPPEYNDCKDLNSLMLLGGEEWWIQNGSGRDMIFFLSDDEGELSLAVLRNYLLEREVEIEL